MWKPAVTCVLIASASAQTTPSAFSKAPKNVEDALKARVNQFYQYHVDNKYRLAEALVATEAKDGFYAANKPLLESFKLGEIVYSDHYTKAKVTVVGKMMMNFMGMAAPQMMDVPFPSYWKLQGGKWVWFIYSDPNRMTPFGRANGPTSSGSAPNPADAFRSAPNVAAIQSGVKTDKGVLALAKSPGSKDTLTLTNTLQGPVSLSIDSDSPGLVVKLEPRDLKAGEKSVVTVEAEAAKAYPNRVVRVLVKPSNQAIDINVKFQ